MLRPARSGLSVKERAGEVLATGTTARKENGWSTHDPHVERTDPRAAILNSFLGHGIHWLSQRLFADLALVSFALVFVSPEAIARPDAGQHFGRHRPRVAAIMA